MASLPTEYDYSCPICEEKFNDDLKQCPRCGLPFHKED